MPIVRPFSRSKKYRERYIVVGNTAFDLQNCTKTRILHRNNLTGFITYTGDQLKAIHTRYWKLSLGEKYDYKKYMEEHN